MTNFTHVNGPSSPQSPNSGPYEPFQNEFRRVRQMLGLFFDEPEDVLRNFYQNILSLPPEERFTKSQERLKELLLEEVGDLDTIRAIAPINKSDLERHTDLFIDLSEDLISNTLEGVLGNREAEGLICLSAGYAAIRHGFVHLKEHSDTPEEDKEQIMSCTLAFFARLIHLQDLDEEDVDEEIVIKDIAYTLHYIEDAVDEETHFVNPDTLEFEKVQQQVREFGAVLAYASLNISVGRGAELAGVSQYEFKKLLDRFDVEPRYGPPSVEDLYDDGVGIMDG